MLLATPTAAAIVSRCTFVASKAAMTRIRKTSRRLKWQTVVDAADVTDSAAVDSATVDSAKSIAGGAFVVLGGARDATIAADATTAARCHVTGTELKTAQLSRSLGAAGAHDLDLLWIALTLEHILLMVLASPHSTLPTLLEVNSPRMRLHILDTWSSAHRGRARLRCSGSYLIQRLHGNRVGN